MKRIHAHPLCALMKTECRMLCRHGLILLYLLLSALYIAALRFLVPAEFRQTITALLLLTDPAAFSLFFMGAIVLYEKNQHVHAALYPSGVRASTCVTAKCLVMSLWGTFVGCMILWFSNPAVFAQGMPILNSLLNGDFVALCVTAACMLLGGVLFTCLAIIASRFVKSLNGYLLASAFVELFFLMPAVIDLFWALPTWASFHPTVFLIRALASPANILIWVSDPMQWAHLAALLCVLLLVAQGACAAMNQMLRGAREVA